MPRVRVPQAKGEIRISPGKHVWSVRNHVAEVKEDDLPLFLRCVRESKVIESKPDFDKEE